MSVLVIVKTLCVVCNCNSAVFSFSTGTVGRKKCSHSLSVVSILPNLATHLVISRVVICSY